MLREKKQHIKNTHDTRVKLKRLKEVHMTKTHTEVASGLYEDTRGHMSEKDKNRTAFTATHTVARFEGSSLGRLSLDV